LDFLFSLGVQGLAPGARIACNAKVRPSGFSGDTVTALIPLGQSDRCRIEEGKDMTDEKKANENEPKNPVLIELEEKKAKLELKIAAIKAEDEKKKTRRKIMVGGWIMSLAKTDTSFSELLENRFYPTLKSPRDRMLFGLSPLPTPQPIAPPAADLGQPGTGKIHVRFPSGNPGREVLDAMKATGKGWKWDGETSVWIGEADPDAVRNAVEPVAVEITEAQ
jgi:hypothetical protein